MNNFYRILLTISLICISEFNLFDAVVGDGADFTEKKEKILSRRRRYLIFPEGSSFQLVYDGVYTVPDYTIYIVTGVTCALAWGLPSKPTYPDFELMEKYENGTLPLLLRRKDENATATDTKQTVHPQNSNTRRPANIELDHRTILNLFRKFYDASRHRYSAYNSTSNWNRYDSRYPTHLGSNRPVDSYYFGNHRNNSIWSNNNFDSRRKTIPLKQNYGGSDEKVIYYSDVYGGGNANIRPPLLSHVMPVKKNSYDSFTNYIAQTYFKPWIEGDDAQNTKTIPPKTSTTESGPIIRKLHTIYPAMGKRSTENYAKTFEEKFYVDHHRDTRHNLYKLIEKYLFAKGFNGTACVLKTLCEVGQKRQEDEPGSFLAEIIRVIFSLPPAQLKHAVEKRHIDYDYAHGTSDNCTERYDSCKDSVWNAGFLLEAYQNVSE